MSTITAAPRVAPVRRTTTSARRPAAPARSGQVRLTRRGRLVVFALALLAVALVAVWLAAGSAATQEAGEAGQIEVVTVAPGDTLWDIAGAAAGDDDVRDVMHRIQQLNTLDGSVVYVGQQLRVPAGD